MPAWSAALEACVLRAPPLRCPRAAAARGRKGDDEYAAEREAAVAAAVAAAKKELETAQVLLAGRQGSGRNRSGRLAGFRSAALLEFCIFHCCQARSLGCLWRLAQEKAVSAAVAEAVAAAKAEAQASAAAAVEAARGEGRAAGAEEAAGTLLDLLYLGNVRGSCLAPAPSGWQRGGV